MRREEIRKALDEYADRRLGTRPDLWPGVQRALWARPARGIQIEPVAAPASRWAPAAGLIGLLLVALLLAPALFERGPVAPATTPSPVATATPVATAVPPAAVRPTPGPGDRAYSTLWLADLAKRLGVDPGTLDSAFQGAAQETIDQAVRDGALTPAQAAQARVQAGRGLAALLADEFAAQGANATTVAWSALLDRWLATPPTR